MKQIDFKYKIWEITLKIIAFGLIPTAAFFYHPALIQTKEVIEYKLNINQPSFSEIKNKVDNKTKNKIEDLILEDKENIYSEIAGIVTLKDDSLEFYVIPTSNEKKARKAESYKDDWKSFYEYIKKNKNGYVEITRTRENLVDALIQKLGNENISNKTKNRLTNFMIDCYIDSSNNRSFHNYKDYHDFYFNNIRLKGDYIGDFHIHDNGEKVSEQDISESYNNRTLILISKKQGFELVDIVKGNINRYGFKY
jgi:hypothetical protein